MARAGLTDLGTTGWGEEDEHNSSASARLDPRQQQQQLLRQQDQGLDVLAEVIARQKSLAGAIGAEIEEQSALVDDISDLTDRSAGRIQRQTQQVRRVDRRAAGTGWYWLVIVLLLVAIVVVVLW